MTTVFLPKFLLIGCCFTLVIYGGCGPPQPELVQVKAEIVDVTESEDNPRAKFSKGMYQQFHEVQMEIYSPERYSGDTLLVNAEARVMGGELKMVTVGTKLEFFVDPRLLNRNKPTSMSELYGRDFVSEE